MKEDAQKAKILCLLCLTTTLIVSIIMMNLKVLDLGSSISVLKVR